MISITVKVLAWVIFFVLCCGHTGFATTQTFKMTGAVAEFMAVGKPGFLRINGEGGAPTGTLSSDGKNFTGVFRCDLAPFHTGIELRDHHMKEKYLDVAKYPQATLILREYAMGAGERPFKATLDLHGVTHEVEGSAEAASHDGKWTIDAKFQISLKSFNIDIPSFAGIVVGEPVNIRVTFDAEEQKP